MSARRACCPSWDLWVIHERLSLAEIREDTFARSERRGRAVAIKCRARVRRYLGWVPLTEIATNI